MQPDFLSFLRSHFLYRFVLPDFINSRNRNSSQQARQLREEQSIKAQMPLLGIELNKMLNAILPTMTSSYWKILISAMPDQHWLKTSLECWRSLVCWNFFQKLMQESQSDSDDQLLPFESLIDVDSPLTFGIWLLESDVQFNARLFRGSSMISLCFSLLARCAWELI